MGHRQLKTSNSCNLHSDQGYYLTEFGTIAVVFKQKRSPRLPRWVAASPHFLAVALGAKVQVKVGRSGTAEGDGAFDRDPSSALDFKSTLDPNRNIPSSNNAYSKQIQVISCLGRF